MPRPVNKINELPRPLRGRFLFSHSALICNWLKNAMPGKIPPTLELTTQESNRPRLYLTFLQGVGIFELTKGLRPKAKYLVVFREEKTPGGDPNKIIELSGPGIKGTKSYYLKKEGNYYLYGLETTGEKTTTKKNPLRDWFEGVGGLPPARQCVSDGQNRIHLGAYKGQNVLVKKGLLPNQSYEIIFYEEEETYQGERYLNLCLEAKILGQEPLKYYFRFRGRFYCSARAKALANREETPENVLEKRASIRVSLLVRDFLEGRGKNPQERELTIYDGGRAVLTSLSNGEPIFLRGLGQGKRKATAIFEERPNGNVMVRVQEKNGLEINRFEVRVEGEIKTRPTSEYRKGKKALPEVEQILDWLGLDKQGNLVETSGIVDYKEALTNAPFFTDLYQAVWWAQSIRQCAEKSPALSEIVKDLWFAKKLNRQDLKAALLMAHSLKIYLSFSKGNEPLPFFSSYPELFSFLWEKKSGQSLATIVKAMFVGGMLVPRRKAVFYQQLASAYEYAQQNLWVLELEVENNPGKAFKKLILEKHKNGATISYRKLFLSLIATGKLFCENPRMLIMALNYVLDNLVFIEQELTPLQAIWSSPENTERTLAGLILKKFDKRKIVNKQGEPYPEEMKEFVVVLVANTFGPAVIVRQKKHLSLFGLIKKEQAQKTEVRMCKENALFALAQRAPHTEDALAVVDWLLANRVGDYSLGYHLDYLRDCQKLSSQEYIAAHFIAGAADFVLSSQGQALDEVKAAINDILPEKNLTLFRIARAISKKNIWQRKDLLKKLSKNFVYAVVLVAFHLYWEELLSFVKGKMQKKDISILIKRLAQQAKKDVEKILSVEQETAIFLASIRQKQGDYRHLTKEEERKLVALVQAGSVEAETVLVKKYDTLITMVASKYSTKENRDDFMQMGRIKIIHLAKIFRVREEEVWFRDYARKSLDLNLKRQAIEDTGLIHIPAWVIKARAQIKKAKQSFFDLKGYEPSDIELAAFLNMDIEELISLTRENYHTVSLNAPVGKSGKTLGDFIASPTPDENF